MLLRLRSPFKSSFSHFIVTDLPLLLGLTQWLARSLSTHLILYICRFFVDHNFCKLAVSFYRCSSIIKGITAFSDKYALCRRGLLWANYFLYDKRPRRKLVVEICERFFLKSGSFVATDFVAKFSPFSHLCSPFLASSPITTTTCTESSNFPLLYQLLQRLTYISEISKSASCQLAVQSSLWFDIENLTRLCVRLPHIAVLLR